ncbi:iron complex outermembrane receptor protein [Stella humosa]|uniref:Iron complex outermembrane receptor protein n=1 Tax=Stella humosa TaxID=94 RepID=A0A3N1L366_9PROT|nr:TonB-dependent receptor [Stella humosa]ROP83855.1 iron complex outermembrane receptor protein [Stella humosa]BBK32883.1 TonB-dependent receptor [Stella humosa]
MRKTEGRGGIAARAVVMLGTLAASGPAMAQTLVEGGAVNLGSILVTAPLGQSRSDIVEGTTLLEGDALDRRRALTIGETLRGTPGVASSGYAEGASRPVIRGQSGPRVRVLQNGLDTFDASNVSPDHAVAAPMAGVERVEVLRGPATLLYGSSAVGGLVNVIDGRIPERRPKGGLAGTARFEYGTGAHDLTGFGAVDAALGRNLVLHAEGFAQNSSDYAIPGFANDEARERGVKGRVENSFVRTRGGSAGASYIGDWGYAGLSIARFASKYGIPSGGHVHADEGEDHDHEHEHDHEHDHEHAEEAPERVTIDLRQTRYDAKFGLTRPFSGVEEVRGRVGYADYRHKELEDGVAGTVFKNRSWEGRLEAEHAPIGGLKGVAGIQGGRRDFRAIGDEAFVPPTVTDSYAAFLLEKYELGPWLFTAGGRLEHTRVEAAALGSERNFTGANLALGATYRLGDGWQVGASLSRTERAPSAEELFANGPHLATSSFEIGDPTLGKETAWTAELSLRRRRGDVTGGINLFASRYQNFIFGDFTGSSVDGLDVLRYRQTDADFRGFELEAGWTVLRRDGLVLSLDGQLDFVWAENRSSGDPLPRIPPVSYTVGANADLGQLTLRGEVQGALRQGRNAPNETDTGGYAFLNVSMSWRPLPDNDAFTLQLQGRNLTDAEGRNHVSLLKDVAPMRGREVRLVGQVQF